MAGCNGPDRFKPLSFQEISSVGEEMNLTHNKIIATEHFIYTYGDVGDNRFPRRCFSKMPSELWRFSKTTRSWTRLKPKGDLPPATLAVFCFEQLDAETFFLLGRDRGFLPMQSSNDIFTQRIENGFLLDVPTLTWKKVRFNNAVADNIPSICSPSFVYDKTKKWLYAFCPRPFPCVAFPNGSQMRIHRLDCTTMQWSTVAESPPRLKVKYRASMALWEDKLYLLFSEQRRRQEPLPLGQHKFTVLTVDCQQNAWERHRLRPDDRSRFPRSRLAFATLQYRDHLFIFGGFTGTQFTMHSVNILRKIWSLHLPTFTWKSHLNFVLPMPLREIKVAVTDAGELSLVASRRVHEPGPNDQTILQTWLTIPSLQTIVSDIYFTRVSGQVKKKCQTHTTRSGLAFKFEDAPKLVVDEIMEDFSKIQKSPSILRLHERC